MKILTVNPRIIGRNFKDLKLKWKNRVTSLRGVNYEIKIASQLRYLVRIELKKKVEILL